MGCLCLSNVNTDDDLVKKLHVKPNEKDPFSDVSNKTTELIYSFRDEDTYEKKISIADFQMLKVK